MAAKKSPYAAQIAKNTTGYRGPGGGPTYTPYGVAQQPTAMASYGAAPGAQGGGANQSVNPFETDPGYLAALAAEQAGAQQIDNALRAAQEQAIVRFGDPALAQLAGFQLDPLTAAMAQQNTESGNSTLAQLNRTRDQNQRTTVNNLAAHGMVYSGDLGFKTGENQRDYGSALYNTQQDLLQSLAGLSSNAVSQKQGLRGNTTQALTTAYGNYIQNPAMWGAGNADPAGATAAASTIASTPVGAAPVTSAIAGAKSKLAAKPAVNPYRYQVAKNMRAG